MTDERGPVPQAPDYVWEDTDQSEALQHIRALTVVLSSEYAVVKRARAFLDKVGNCPKDPLKVGDRLPGGAKVTEVDIHGARAAGVWLDNAALEALFGITKE